MSIERCKGALKYRGIRYPCCNGGEPCNTCLAKWRENHRRYPNEILRPPHPVKKRLPYTTNMVAIVDWMMKGFYKIT